MVISVYTQIVYSNTDKPLKTLHFLPVKVLPYVYTDGNTLVTPQTLENTTFFEGVTNVTNAKPPYTFFS